jgi:AdoMet-dependent rRNA methyltransferase SPB1
VGHTLTSYTPGYEEGDWTQFKEAPVSDFIQTTDPIAMLGSMNKLSFEMAPNGDIAVKILFRLIRFLFLL